MVLNRKHFIGHDKMLILDQENNENTCNQYHVHVTVCNAN